MYDNLELVLNKDKAPGIDFLKSVPQRLTTVVSEGTSLAGDYITGYLDSIRVNISENRVRLANFSLCKYWLGDNFKTLTKGDTRLAVEKISQDLHLPFGSATITRLDFGCNLIMQFPERLYYPYMGEALYYKRLPQPNGLYYSNQLRQLVFYGKEYEQRIKRQPIPELYQRRHVLRYEARFKSQLRRQFKKHDIVAAMLSDEDFFSDLIGRWENEYLAIQKINTKLISMKPSGSKKGFIENLALFSILELGQDKVLNKVKEWQVCGDI